MSNLAQFQYCKEIPKNPNRERKRCTEPECDKRARGLTVSMKTNRGPVAAKCIAHGGGKRCTEPECDKRFLMIRNKNCRVLGVENFK